MRHEWVYSWCSTAHGLGMSRGVTGAWGAGAQQAPQGARRGGGGHAVLQPQARVQAAAHKGASAAVKAYSQFRCFGSRAGSCGVARSRGVAHKGALRIREGGALRIQVRSTRRVQPVHPPSSPEYSPSTVITSPFTVIQTCVIRQTCVVVSMS